MQKETPAVFNSTSNPKRILFATVPADGHFNPLTGLAVHLKNIGHDVRWYASSYYAAKLKKMDIPHYPVRKALEFTTYNLDEVFPERDSIKGQVKKLKFDMKHVFILRGPEYYQDLQDIHKDFPFDVMIGDNAFTGIPFVKDLMKIPVLTMGIMPLTETSRDLPPAGLGLQPAKGLGGKVRDAVLRKITNKLIFGEPNKLMEDVLTSHGIDPEVPSLFDTAIRKSSYFLQSGTPGFEYKRTDLSENIRYIGALLPHQSARTSSFTFREEWKQYRTKVLVTQGTVEKDPSKLIIPTLEAFKDTSTLVIVTTGGWNTEELRKKYPYRNIVIENFIPFNEIMPLMDVYVTNGGYGGVMLAIENRLPMVVAGVHEGKLEINARVNYFKLGINLKTETPSQKKIRDAVDKIAADKTFKANVSILADEFAGYDPMALIEKYVQQATAGIEVMNKAVA
jgi:UDP:flavonoid glycosyltransferase YjiC (YdhE family)